MKEDPGPSAGPWPHRAAGAAGWPVPAFPLYVVLGFIPACIWAGVSLIEETPSILFFHLLFGVMSFLIVARLSRKRTAFNILFVSSGIRTLASLIGFYGSPDRAYRFATGTNEDSMRFFDASFLPLKDAMISFAEPGFSFVNHFVTLGAQSLGGAHYLASIQVVLWFGSLFPVMVYLLVQDGFSNEKAAPLVGWGLALHPLAIAFSTGLMRDALVAALGWLMVLLILRVRRRVGWPRIKLLAVIFMIALGVATLRVLSSLTFILLGGAAYLVFSKGTERGANKRRVLLVGGGLVLVALIIGLSRLDRLIGVFDYAVAMRGGGVASGQGLAEMGQVNATGLTQRIWDISPLLLVILSPLQIMVPIPFYAWDPHPWVGGPARFIDVLAGFGSLCNQVLFGFFLVALAFWRRAKAWGELLFCGLSVFLIGWANLIGLGQVRYMTAHALPLFLYSTVVGYQTLEDKPGRRNRRFAAWLAILGAGYLYLLSSIIRG